MHALPEIDYDSHPAYAPFRLDAGAQRDEALARLEPVLESKRRWLTRGADVFASRVRAAKGDATCDALAREGAVAVRLTEDVLSGLRLATAFLLSDLQTLHRSRQAKGKPLKFRDTQADIRVNGQWTDAGASLAGPLDTLLRANGVFDLAESYYPGSTAQLHSACVRRNVEDQPFFTRGGGSTPRSMGLHIDSAASASLNGVIYLNEVGPEQGPFRYVKGSNHWDWDLHDRAIRKAVDESGFPAHGDSTFLALPPELRRRANFGVDLMDDASDSKALQAREAMFCSEMGEMVLFDSDGVHRGGDVRSGSRSAILFVLAMDAPRRTASAGRA